MGTAGISAPAVQAAVQRYWRVLMDKSAGEMETLYRHDANVFNPFGTRPEPGRLSAARKERQYFSPKTSFRADITGPIEVNILADNVAVATYTFRWYATNMFETAMVNNSDKAVRDGRGTQIFVLDQDGRLRIVHEHLSDIWRDTGQSK